MNFNNHSKFFKSAFRNFNKSGSKSTFSGSTFKTFFTYNMKRNICFLNSLYKSKSNGVMLLNHVNKMNFMTITGSDSLRKTVTFLANDSMSNGGLSLSGQKINSVFMTLLEEVIRLEDTLLENGR